MFDNTTHRIKKIKQAIKNENISQLMIFGKKYGFYNNQLRKEAWILLLGINDNEVTPNKNVKLNAQNHHQIDIDIDRTVFIDYIRTTNNLSVGGLSNILYNTFDYITMEYTQGFNYVASVIYIVCNDEYLSIKLFKELIKKKLQRYAHCNKTCGLLIHGIDLLNKLILKYNPKLYKIIQEMDQNNFLLIFLTKWMLTLGGEFIKDISKICLLFDYIISHSEENNIMVYICASSLLYINKHMYYDTTITFEEHFCNINWSNIDINYIIKYSQKLYKKYPPSNVLKLDKSIKSSSYAVRKVYVLCCGYWRQLLINNKYIYCDIVYVISLYYPNGESLRSLTDISNNSITNSIQHLAHDVEQNTVRLMTWLGIKNHTKNSKK